MSQESYHTFASVYDHLMEDIPYEKWRDSLVRFLTERGIADGLVAELGCGTGTMTELLCAAGYDMIGIDSSGEMLAQAMEKRANSGSGALYLLQDMRSFELYGTVRAFISVCDTMNYLEDTASLTDVLRLVNNYLDPGGVFIFDLKTTAYYEKLGDSVLCDADEEASYIWENCYDPETRDNEYYLTLFLPAGREGLYRRSEEYHRQHAFILEEIRQAVLDAGMALEAAADEDGGPVRADSERIYIIAREKGKTPEAGLSCAPGREQKESE